jgi:hypothetical protein
MTTIVSGSSITFNDNTTQNTSAYGGGFAFRNRIINGDMVINQRGFSGTPTDGAYTLDRWYADLAVASKFTVSQNAGSVTPPAGFVNYLGVTSSSAYSISATDIFTITQRIEGYNISDFAWGTANARTVTLSFWVRSSLTGTFGGALRNNGNSRNYPFNYTISAANTWEQKTVTISGDTSGTWLSTNGVGVTISFGLGVGSTYSGTAGAWSSSLSFSATGATSVVGTNGATWYITGVQLEKGSTATSFDYRPYGTELALCQRYYYKLLGEQAIYCEVYAASGSLPTWTGCLPVSMRASPTGTLIGTYAVSNCANVSVNTTSSQTINLQANSVSSTGRTYFHSPTSGGYSVSAEL